MNGAIARLGEQRARARAGAGRGGAGIWGGAHTPAGAGAAPGEAGRAVATAVQAAREGRAEREEPREHPRTPRTPHTPHSQASRAFGVAWGAPAGPRLSVHPPTHPPQPGRPLERALPREEGGRAGGRAADYEAPTMVRCDRGLQMLLTTAGAFAAFSLMAIAIGTDYWLYSSAHICNGTNLTMDDGPPPRRARGDLTHSGLWRVCCLEGTAREPPDPLHTRTHPPGEKGCRWARHHRLPRETQRREPSARADKLDTGSWGGWVGGWVGSPLVGSRGVCQEDLPHSSIPQTLHSCTPPGTHAHPPGTQ